jgi:hypothetical protein
VANPLAGYHPRAVLLTQAFGRPLKRASQVGLFAGILAGAVADYGLQAAPSLVAGAVAIGVTVGIGFAVTLALVPTKVRRSFEVFSWVAAREIDRFRERTASTSPRSAAAVTAWLEANPVGPVTREARVEMLVSVGRQDEARAELAALGAGTTDLKRLEIAGLRAFAETVETGTFDQAAYDAVLASLPPGSDLALEGRVTRAANMARSRLARGEPDPLGPMAAMRPRLGRAATTITLRRTWAPFLQSLALLGVAIALFGYILRGGLGGLFG